MKHFVYALRPESLMVNYYDVALQTRFRVIPRSRISHLRTFLDKNPA